MLDKKADLADVVRHGHDVRDVVGLVETFAVVNERLVALTGLAESQQHVLQHHTHAPLVHTHNIEDIPQYVLSLEMHVCALAFEAIRSSYHIYDV